MSAPEPLCLLIGITPSELTNEENIILEADLFLCICEELKEIYRIENEGFFRLMKITTERKNTMLEANLARLIVRDILFTGEYTLEGIAHYTNQHEDVIQDVLIGQNLNPSASLLRKILELHRIVRSELYRAISKKIADKHLSIA